MPKEVDLKLKIKGMHCEACVRRVTARLGALPGVRVDHVEVGQAELEYDPLKTDTKAIAAAMDEIGFQVEA